MELKISYGHIESSQHIETTVKNKIEKLKKYFQGKMNVDWICSLDGTIHTSDVTITGDHFTYHAKSENDNLYKTFDDILPKLEKQLKKRKEQTRSIIHKNSRLKGSD